MVLWDSGILATASQNAYSGAKGAEIPTLTKCIYNLRKRGFLVILSDSVEKQTAPD